MAEFHTVARASEMAPGEMKLVDVDGEEVVIANVDGEYLRHRLELGHCLPSSRQLASITS